MESRKSVIVIVDLREAYAAFYDRYVEYTRMDQYPDVTFPRMDELIDATFVKVVEHAASLPNSISYHQLLHSYSRDAGIETIIEKLWSDVNMEIHRCEKRVCHSIDECEIHCIDGRLVKDRLNLIYELKNKDIG